LLKTVTEKVLRNSDNRKVSYEMANVVKDSGEGRCFLWQGDATEAAKNVVLEPLASAVGGAAFLHNVIIEHTDFQLKR
jgi:hypothetical protein